MSSDPSESSADGGKLLTRSVAGFGFLLVGLAVAMAAAPTLSWTLQAQVDRIAAHGLLAGHVLTAGLVVVAIGTMLGIPKRAPRIAMPQQKSGPGNEWYSQCESTLGQVLGCVANVREELAAMGRHIGHADGSGASGPIQAEQVDALFKLAASLDQLHAKLETSLGSRIDAIEGRMMQVVASVEDNRTAITRLLGTPPDSLVDGIDEHSRGATNASEDVVEEEPEPTTLAREARQPAPTPRPTQAPPSGGARPAPSPARQPQKAPAQRPPMTGQPAPAPRAAAGPTNAAPRQATQDTNKAPVVRNAADEAPAGRPTEGGTSLGLLDELDDFQAPGVEDIASEVAALFAAGEEVEALAAEQNAAATEENTNPAAAGAKAAHEQRKSQLSEESLDSLLPDERVRTALRKMRKGDPF